MQDGKFAPDLVMLDGEIDPDLVMPDGKIDPVLVMLDGKIDLDLVMQDGKIDPHLVILLAKIDLDQEIIVGIGLDLVMLMRKSARDRVMSVAKTAPDHLRIEKMHLNLVKPKGKIDLAQDRRVMIIVEENQVQLSEAGMR